MLRLTLAYGKIGAPVIYLFIYLFIGLKHTNHAIKHNMSRSMYRTLTDMSKITSDSYTNQFCRTNYKLQNKRENRLKAN